MVTGATGIGPAGQSVDGQAVGVREVSPELGERTHRTNASPYRIRATDQFHRARDEYGDAVIEANRQQRLLRNGHVKSTADWHLYQRAMANIERLTRERER